MLREDVMKAARFYDRGDIRIEDIPEPTAAPGEALIKAAWCGICGTDPHERLDGPIFCPPRGHPQPASGEESPVPLGHEFFGVVEALCVGVDALAVGDHVVLEPYIISEEVDTTPGNKSYHLAKNMNFIGLAGRGRWTGRIDRRQAAVDPQHLSGHATR